jgi:hypothetical protein
VRNVYVIIIIIGLSQSNIVRRLYKIITAVEIEPEQQSSRIDQSITVTVPRITVSVSMLLPVIFERIPLDSAGRVYI